MKNILYFILSLSFLMLQIEIKSQPLNNYPHDNNNKPEDKSGPKEEFELNELSAETIFDIVKHSVVAIAAYDFNNEYVGISGTGVVIEPGIVVTNYHVFKDYYDLKIILLDEQRTVITDNPKILNADPQIDLLILGIDNYNLPKINLGNINEIKVGNRVYALGNPGGDIQGIYLHTFTSGIISGIRQNDDFWSWLNLKIQYEADGSIDLIQFDTPISPGNSGGALINNKGELIGIPTWKLQTTHGFENMNFAIPVNKIHELLAGVNIYDNTFNEAQKLYYQGLNAANLGYDATAVTLFDKAKNLLYSPEYKAEKNILERKIAFHLGNVFWKMAYYLKENEEENYRNAMASYLIVIELKPDHYAAYNKLGYIYYYKNEYSLAMEYYNKSIMIDSTSYNAQVFSNRGNLFRAMGNFSEALKDLTKAYEYDPYDPEIYFNLGNYYYDIGDYFTSEKYYSECIKINEDYNYIPKSAAYNNRGMSNYKLKRYYKAIEDFDMSIRIDSIKAIAYPNITNQEAYYNRGLVYSEILPEKITQFYNEQAIKDMEYAIKLNKTYEYELNPRIAEIKDKINKSNKIKTKSSKK